MQGFVEACSRSRSSMKIILTVTRHRKRQCTTWESMNVRSWRVIEEGDGTGTFKVSGEGDSSSLRDRRQ